MTTSLKHTCPPSPAPPSPLPASRKSYGDGDPNQRLPGWLGRFFRPIGLVALGAICIGIDIKFWEESQVMRLGTTLLIVGTLWATAVGFALGTLRLVAAVVSVVVVFLLTSVGGDARTEVEETEYQSLRSELDIELNLLRGARTTRGQVTEELLAGAASQIEGVRVKGLAEVASADLQAWRDELEAGDFVNTDNQVQLVDSYIQRLDSLTDQLEEDLDPTREAVTIGWEILGPPGPAPFVEADRVAGVPTDDGSVGDGLPSTPSGGAASTESRDVSTDEQDEQDEAADEPLPDSRADEPADAAARHQMELAQDGAASIDAAVRELKQLFEQLDNVGLARNETSDDLPLPPLPLALESPAPAVTNVDQALTCVETSTISSDFSEVTPRANACVTGCSRGDGPCQPLAAKAILLRGFQEQLVVLTRGENVTESQEALTSRLAEIRSQLEALDDPVAIHRLAMVGADEILGDVIRAFVLDDDRPARLGGWGWLVLTLAAIVGYRLLEIANDRRSPGPVLVRAGDSPEETAAKTAAATELVRAHLTAANLQEPSPLPGGEAVSSISNSTETTGIENAVVRYVVSLLQTTAFPRRGVDLVVTAQPAETGLTASRSGTGGAGAETEKGEASARRSSGKGANGDAPGPPPDEPYRLMVRATNTRCKALMFSHPFEGKTLDEVTHAATYFAAERLLDAGWTTPSWLVWSSHNGTALRAYREVMIDKQSPPQLVPPVTRIEEGRSNRDRLRDAVRASPGTGAALVALSHEAALEGDIAAALHHLLLARVRHERFLTVRYRLGVTLSMMVCDINQHWHLDDDQELDPQASNHVHGAMDMLGQLVEDWPPTRDRLTSLECSRLMLRQALKELDFVIDAVRFNRILWRTHRQDEREYWLGLIRSPRRRRGLAAAALSAKALAKRRLLHTDGLWQRVVDNPELLESESSLVACDELNRNALETAPDDWLVRYNAACYTAAKSKERRLISIELAKGQSGTDRTQSQVEQAACQAEIAFDHLRRARYASNGQQLDVRWAHADPDLKPLFEYCKSEDTWRDRLACVFQIERQYLNELLDAES